MKKQIKVFIIFALLLLLVLVAKFYKEYHDMEQLKINIAKENAKSLSAFMMAFRQTYQKAFVHNKIPIDEKTIHLLPVKTTKDIGDTFSQIIHNSITIKTVSNRPRNPTNQANKYEMEMINYFKKNIDKEYSFKKHSNDTFHYTKPLYVKQGCLKCHGKKEQAIQTIRNRYDTAYGYKIGDLRGILSIELSKNDIIRNIDNNFQRNITVAIIIYILFLFAIYTMIKIIVKNEKGYNSILEEKIQELKKKDDALIEINENLEQRIILEVDKSNKQQKQILESAKMVAMGEMIGNIAHQWRQPLSMISTSATGMIMQKECDISIKDDEIKMLNSINDNAQYLSKTIDDFKNYIKGDRKIEKFNLKDTIDTFLNLVNSSIKNHNLDVILDLQDDIILENYPNELVQCFINIFNNAKDVLVEKEIKNKLIFISIFMQKDKAIIKIKDNAGGIPKDILPKIFEPYFTTKHQSQGTGLGLHMTYNLIFDGMSGTIEASNVSYKYDNKYYIGAEFIIVL